jgi:hypothetical protein
MTQSFFDCGNIYENKRADNHRENLYRYCVRSLSDLQNKIIPFFLKYQLKTNKRFDFETFCLCVDMISKKEHLDADGLEHLRKLATAMNRQKIRS